MNNILSVENLCLWYGSHQALKDINIEIPEKSITALIGPSGCGKSTFLRCINRMNDLIEGTRVEGTMTLDGNDIYAESVAESVIAYALTALRDIPKYRDQLLKDGWSHPDWYNEGLLDQPVGLVGFGAHGIR